MKRNRLRENPVSTREAPRDRHVWPNRNTCSQDAQKGRPARPSASQEQKRTLGSARCDEIKEQHVWRAAEWSIGLSGPPLVRERSRTKLAGFFSILTGSAICRD